MPLKVGGTTYPKFKNLVAAVSRKHPHVKNPSAYAAAVARKVEPDFDKLSAQARKKAAK